MATSTDIANFALGRLGGDRIVNLADEDDENARLCNNFFEHCAKMVLRSHRWNCCTKREALAKLASAPAFGYGNQFQLPDDFLRAVEINGNEVWNPETEWKIEGDKILTDEDAVELVYIYWEPDASQYDEMLVDAISILLASKIAAPLTGNPAMAQSLLQEYEQYALGKARKIDSQEDTSGEQNPLRALINRSNVVLARKVTALG